MTPIFVESREVQADSVQHLDLADIQRAGTIIAGTLSGPDTYYEYRGQEFGLQFRLAQDFARSIGVRLRMETSPDTITLLANLHSGKVDFIALEMPEWLTRSTSPALTAAIRQWWQPERKVQLAEAARQSATPRRRARPFMLNRARGTISSYDDLFIRHSATAGMDWRLLAATCYQESGFDPQARSWAGAQGLMQIMPATAELLGVPTSQIYQPETNIAAGARYIGMLQHEFRDIADTQQRLRFVLAAYNGGTHHIRDAMALTQKHGRNTHRWEDVATFVLRLSDPTYYRDPVVKNGYMRGSETETYVRQIIDRWKQYCGLARSASGNTKPAPSKKHLKDGEHISHVRSAEEIGLMPNE